MLSIRCILLRDTFEGGASPDSTTPEWPPSPMRLFSSFVSVADHAGGSEDEVLRTLEALPPPEIHYGRDAGGFYRSAFVPTNAASDKPGSMTFPGRTNGKRGWARAVPRSREIWYCWPDAELPSDQRGRLADLCRRVSYLGRTTSPVLMEVTDDEPGSLERLVPDAVASDNFAYRQSIRVPYRGALDALRAAHEAKYEKGESGDPWEIGSPADYGTEAPAVENTPAVDGPYGTLVILALIGRRLDGRHTARVSRYVRKALLDRAGEHVPGLHGHHGREAEHCAILGLPFVGTEHADGHLLGVAVALPRRLSAQERTVVASALPSPDEALRVTAGPLGILEFERLTPLAAGRRPWGLSPDRWIAYRRGAQVWTTALPMVFDRFLKRRDDVAAEVRRAVVHSGYPEPEVLEVSQGPLIPGALDLTPADTMRRSSGRGFKPYRHVQVQFKNPVRGPVVIGSMRHHGLGLCVPLNEDAG